MVDTTNVIRLPETGAWEGVPRLENGWRPTGGAVNPGADEGLLNWPLQVLAARDRVLKDRVDLLSQRADVEVTVGAGGQFATINEALAHLSERRPGYVSGGFQARVRLRPGFVMREQVAVSGVNLGWIRLVSSDAEVQIDRSYLTANIGGRYPAFSARSGGQLPVIDTLFSMMSTGAAAGRDGIFVFDGGAVTVGSGKGVKAAGGNGIGAATDIVVQKGATINAVEATGGTSVTPNTVSANGIIFK